MSAAKERVRVPAGRDASAAVALPPGKAVVETHNGRPLALSPEPTSMLAVIARAAADPNVNVDKMQALLSMQQQIEDRDARKAFTIAFGKLQKDLPSIRRDGKIEIREKDAQGGRSGRVQQSTPYATFNAIMKAIKKPLDKNGFTLSFATSPAADGRIIVRGILAHEEGHERTTEFPLPAETSGSKNNVQGWGSAMSYGKRYCTIALVNIVSEATEDADTDGYEGDFKPAKGGAMVESEVISPITATQRDIIVDLITKAGIPEKNFCVKYGIDQIRQLPSDMFDHAKKAIADHVAGKK
jgi:hypothetical protein